MSPQRPGSVEIRAQSLGACEALRLLHYGGQAGNPDSHSAISFWRKHNGRFENLGGILSHELNSEWHRLTAAVASRTLWQQNKRTMRDHTCAS